MPQGLIEVPGDFVQWKAAVSAEYAMHKNNFGSAFWKSTDPPSTIQTERSEVCLISDIQFEIIDTHNTCLFHAKRRKISPLSVYTTFRQTKLKSLSKLKM